MTGLDASQVEIEGIIPPDDAAVTPRTLAEGIHVTRNRINAIWASVLVSTAVAGTLRLTGVLPGDTLDYALGLAGLAVTLSTLGGVILRQDPTNRVGRLFLALSCSETVTVWLRLLATSHPHAKGAAVVGVIEEALRNAGFAGAGVLLLIFPTGRLVSPRWRLGVALFGALVFFGALIPVLTPGVIDGLPPVRNTFATARMGHAAKLLAPVGGIVGISFLVAALSLVVRYRRARELERRQIKAFSIAVLSVVVIIVVTAVAFPKQMNGIAGSLVWQLPWLVPPGAAAYAIVKHGLFDINRVISRTVSYAIVTVVLGGTFAAIVLLPSAAIGSSGAPSWLVAMATLAVAFLFQPVRVRVQNAVDRRFNRARYDASQTIETFVVRLREEVDLEALQAELSDVVVRTMQPSQVGVWLAPSNRS
jgi:hypothetical protein